METFKRLLRMIRPYTGRLVWAILCMTFTAGLNSGIALMVKPLMDDIFMQKRWIMLQIIPLAILALYFLKGVFDYTQVYLMNYIGHRLVMQLRNEIFSHIHRLSHRFFADRSTGMLISRANQDVVLVQSTVTEGIANLLRDPLEILGYLAALFYLNWRWALVAVTVLPFVALLIDRLGRKLRRITWSAQERISDLTVILHETFSGAAIVKAFMMEDREIDRFQHANKAYFNELMRAVRVIALSTPLMEFLGAAGLSFVLWYGGLQVFRGQTTPGTFFAFITALLMLYTPIKRLTRVNNQIQQGIAGAQRVFEIIDTEPDIASKPNAPALTPLKDVIEYRSVGFGYNDKRVLKGIDLEVRKGEVVAIVGESGVGKTTLVNLLLRFYDVTSGAILIDGQDIRDVDLASLRKQIGLVTQETILFNDTVRNNIAYGDLNASQTRIEAAAHAAFAHRFINRLPHKYHTVIGERGVMLSGGQRQRLAIARAILKNPPILVLDEATSALDTESERVVQKALENLMQNRTTFVIAHRLSTVQHADKIIVLEAGKIVEMGTHQELLKQQGAYHRLYTLQFQGT
ncbi:MAG: lipid A export permease/ATP-binding protein MsbA [bacterium]